MTKPKHGSKQRSGPADRLTDLGECCAQSVEQNVRVDLDLTPRGADASLRIGVHTRPTTRCDGAARFQGCNKALAMQLPECGVRKPVAEFPQQECVQGHPPLLVECGRAGLADKRADQCSLRNVLTRGREWIRSSN